MLRYCLILMIFVLSFGSCTDTSSPRPVAEKFLEAMRDRDYKEAASYGTPETEKLLRQLERIEALQSGEQRPEMGSVRIVAEEINGRTATIFFMEEGVPEEQKITLEKVKVSDDEGEKGEWKVALRKEELPLPAAPSIE